MSDSENLNTYQLERAQEWDRQRKLKNFIQLGAVEEVLRERNRQDVKWGQQDYDPFAYLAVLTEEVGEAAQAALHLKFGGPEGDNLRNELIQVAAVAVAFVECLDRQKWAWGKFMDK